MTQIAPIWKRRGSSNEPASFFFFVSFLYIILDGAPSPNVSRDFAIENVLTVWWGGSPQYMLIWCAFIRFRRYALYIHRLQ